MNKNNKLRAKEWFKKAGHDLDASYDVLKGSAHPDVAKDSGNKC